MRRGELVMSSTWPGTGLGRANRVLAKAPLAEGEVLDGKYRVERVLGAGGMGVVVAATHVRLAQRVAIKFLLPHAADDGHTVARFAREARALARLDSEHIARVIDVGALATGVPYMVLEHLVGHTLADILNARGPMAIEEAVTHTLEACEAMCEAHAAGIVHRDLKPENLFLASRSDGSQVIKVIDFGISKMTDPLELGPRTSTLTGAASIVGSPLYMSPEQLCAARDADARSDIWSLGVTLFELLTGHGPFVWRSMPELCAAVLKEPARPLRALLPSAPAALEEVLLRCLEKDPSRRPAGMAELAAALRAFAPLEQARSSKRPSRAHAHAHSHSHSPSHSLSISIPSAAPAREVDLTPLHIVEPEPTTRPSALLQLSCMTTVAQPEPSPAFWSLPRMAAVVFVSALLISLATARSLRGPAPALAAEPPRALLASPPLVTLEPEGCPPSLPIAPPEAPSPGQDISSPPRKTTLHPRSASGPRAPPHPSVVDDAFGHRK
jgi:eukaryotic-like serine/threonine-protein kinase